MTVRERKGRLAGLRAGFIGDGYNMANSMIVGCLAVGMTVTVACPPHYRPAADVLMLAKTYGDKFKLVTDPDEAARDADVLFTDVWAAWGRGARGGAAPPGLPGLRWMPPAWRRGWPDCMIQHPLPAHRGEEITAEVLEAHANEIFDEAGEPHLRREGCAGDFTVETVDLLSEKKEAKKLSIKINKSQTKRPCQVENHQQGRFIFSLYLLYGEPQIKSFCSFLSKESYAQIFSKRWARLREKQRTMPITAPMPACKISNGSLMMAYSGVL